MTFAIFPSTPRNSVSSFLPKSAPHKLDKSEPIRMLDGPVHPDVVFMLEYWNIKRGARPMPDRCDISPTDFGRLLPYIGITEVLDGGSDFRFRLFGGEISAMTGIDRTGEAFSLLEPSPETGLTAEQSRQRWMLAARLVVDHRRPIFPAAYAIEPDGSRAELHAVALPLTAGGENVAQIIGAAFILRK